MVVQNGPRLAVLLGEVGFNLHWILVVFLGERSQGVHAFFEFQLGEPFQDGVLQWGVLRSRTVQVEHGKRKKLPNEQNQSAHEGVYNWFFHGGKGLLAENRQKPLSGL